MAAANPENVREIEIEFAEYLRKHAVEYIQPIHHSKAISLTVRINKSDLQVCIRHDDFTSFVKLYGKYIAVGGKSIAVTESVRSDTEGALFTVLFNTANAQNDIDDIETIISTLSTLCLATPEIEQNFTNSRIYVVISAANSECHTMLHLAFLGINLTNLQYLQICNDANKRFNPYKCISTQKITRYLPGSYVKIKSTETAVLKLVDKYGLISVNAENAIQDVEIYTDIGTLISPVKHSFFNICNLSHIQPRIRTPVDSMAQLHYSDIGFLWYLNNYFELMAQKVPVISTDRGLPDKNYPENLHLELLMHMNADRFRLNSFIPAAEVDMLNILHSVVWIYMSSDKNGQTRDAQIKATRLALSCVAEAAHNHGIPDFKVNSLADMYERNSRLLKRLSIRTLYDYLRTDNPTAYAEYVEDNFYRDLLNVTSPSETTLIGTAFAQYLFFDHSIAQDGRDPTIYQHNRISTMQKHNNAANYVGSLLCMYNGKCERLLNLLVRLNNRYTQVLSNNTSALSDTDINGRLTVIRNIINKLKEDTYRIKLTNSILSHLGAIQNSHCGQEPLFDKNPALTALKNGVIQVAYNAKNERKFVFRKGRVEDYLSKCMGGSYDARYGNSTDTHKLYAMLNEFLPSNLCPDAVNWVIAYYGSHFFGINDKFCLMFVGQTDCGKSAFIDFIRRVFDQQHSTLPTNEFSNKEGGTDKPISAILGAIECRSTTFEETTRTIECSVFKQIVGGLSNTFGGRKLYTNSQTHQNMTRLTMANNHIPTFSQYAPEIERRIVVIHVNSRYTDDSSQWDSSRRIFPLDPKIDEKYAQLVDVMIYHMVASNGYYRSHDGRDYSVTVIPQLFCKWRKEAMTADPYYQCLYNRLVCVKNLRNRHINLDLDTVYPMFKSIAGNSYRDISAVQFKQKMLHLMSINNTVNVPYMTRDIFTEYIDVLNRYFADRNKFTATIEFDGVIRTLELPVLHDIELQNVAELAKSVNMLRNAVGTIREFEDNIISEESDTTEEEESEYETDYSDSDESDQSMCDELETPNEVEVS